MKEIEFAEIPEDGLHLEGSFPASIFGLDPKDSIRPTGHVHYEADLYAFEEVVVVSGSLQGPFQLQCGACLEYFDCEADFPSWSSEVDREPKQRSFDFEDLVREEFLLNLPAHPRCDEWVEGRTCPAEPLFVRDEEEEPVPEERSGPNPWSALDELK